VVIGASFRVSTGVILVTGEGNATIALEFAEVLINRNGDTNSKLFGCKTVSGVFIAAASKEILESWLSSLGDRYPQLQKGGKGDICISGD
jgi:hypothetical protein